MKMHSSDHGLVVVCVAVMLCLNGGCSETSTNTGDLPGKPAEKEHSHDALVWVEQGLSLGDCLIGLGHHGDHLHAGENLEPAISVTRQGQPVADAKVFVALMSGDGKSVIGQELQTVYEPPTAEEPAHYAQGQLAVPSGVSSATIRFRIRLPGTQEQLVRQIKVDVH